MLADTKIQNGDIVCDSCKNAQIITGSDALFQRALICIEACEGAFIYNRTLGSRIRDFLSDGISKEDAELIINEALARFEDTRAEVLSVNGDTIGLKITINGESRNEEVRLNGNV